MANTEEAKYLEGKGAAALASVASKIPTPEEMVAREKKTAADAVRISEEKLARRAQILSRGIVNTQLETALRECTPDGRRGRFWRNDSSSIIRAKSLGYEFITVPGKMGLHSSADGKIVIGDLVMLTISEEDARINKELRQRAKMKKMTSPKKEFENHARAEGTQFLDMGSETRIGVTNKGD